VLEFYGLFLGLHLAEWRSARTHGGLGRSG
jgi:hypothetical protein